MSKEQANEFLKKLGTDKAAAAKFKEAFRAALLKAGKDAGFKFTREELDAALAEMKAEIPEGALKGVAGGIVLSTPGNEIPPLDGFCFTP